MIEEHGLHMVLLNDVQKIVVLPQIQYIAVCDATTNSPKSQMCSETVDLCNKAMEWSMFLSWCRGSFPPFKTKKNFSACLNFVLFIVFCFEKNDPLKKMWNTFFSFLLTKECFLRVLSVVEVSAVDLPLFVENNRKETNFYNQKKTV